MRYKFLSSRGKLADPTILSGFKLTHRGSIFSIPDRVIELMPESVARENMCLPIREEGNTLHVAHHDFKDIQLQDKLRFLLNRNVVFHLWPKDEILNMTNQLYGQVEGESADGMLQEFTDTAIDSPKPFLTRPQQKGCERSRLLDRLFRKPTIPTAVGGSIARIALARF